MCACQHECEGVGRFSRVLAAKLVEMMLIGVCEENIDFSHKSISVLRKEPRPQV